MRRLILNVLLSFAQFEREVIVERIRDKIAASKKKGMWMGGVPPLGYRVEDRKLVGEIVHKGQSHPGEHTPIIDQPLWDAAQAQLAGNTADRNSGPRARQPSLLTGVLFDADGNPMTPSHAVKNGMRYRYYVSRPLITKDRCESSIGLRIPGEEIERLVTSRVRQWLLDPGSIYQATRLADASAQRRLVVRAAKIGKSWPELPATRQRAFLTALIERLDVGPDRIDIHFRPTWLGALLAVAATSSPSAADDETQTLSVPVRPRPAAGGRSRC